MSSRPNPPWRCPSQRLHLILLGVRDVARSTRFFEALGWHKSATGNEGFAKFDLGGQAPVFDLAHGAGAGRRAGGAGNALRRHGPHPPCPPARGASHPGAGRGGRRAHRQARDARALGHRGLLCRPDGHLFEVDYEGAWVFDAEHRLVVDEVRPSEVL